MNLSELGDNSSDTSDEDYIPNVKDDASDTEGDIEDDLSGSEGIERSKKRKKHQTASQKKLKNAEKKDLSCREEGNCVLEEEKKKIEDDVWADFMRDTGFRSRKDVCSGATATKANSNLSKLHHERKSEMEDKKNDKIKITQVFKFAGESVTVEKEVPKNSLEAESLKNTSQDGGKNVRNKSSLSGILSQLGKKSKISTLEKSKLDWDQFKREENLEEELQTHNKGKDGYLEKQDFLQRADLRRFEIEKEIRTIERNKRLNNS